MKKVRVLLADDHPMLREGTRLFIEREPDFEVCATASSGGEAVELAAKHRPDVVVLDLRMPDSDGLTVVRQIKKENARIEVVIYSGERGEEIVDRLFEAGVMSFIRKTDPTELLIAAIRAAGEHTPFITPEMEEIIFRRAIGQPSHSDLTAREREVIRMIAEGKLNREIAQALGISARTAEVHRAAIMRKLGASSMADVVRFAIRNGVIEA